MVILEGMSLVLLGVALGVPAAFGLHAPDQRLLFGVKPSDPVVFMAVPILFAAVALCAVWLPARRASAVDPMEALRHE